MRSAGFLILCSILLAPLAGAQVPTTQGFHGHYVKSNCRVPAYQNESASRTLWPYDRPTPVYAPGELRVFAFAHGPDQVTFFSSDPKIIPSRKVQLEGPASYQAWHEEEVRLNVRSPGSPRILRLDATPGQYVGAKLSAGLNKSFEALGKKKGKGIQVKVYPPQRFSRVQLIPEKASYQVGDTVKAVVHFANALPSEPEHPFTAVTPIGTRPILLRQGSRQENAIGNHFVVLRRGGRVPSSALTFEQSGPRTLTSTFEVAVPGNSSLAANTQDAFFELEVPVEVGPSGGPSDVCDLIEGEAVRTFKLLIQNPKGPRNQKAEPAKEMKAKTQMPRRGAPMSAPARQKKVPVQPTPKPSRAEPVQAPSRQAPLTAPLKQPQTPVRDAEKPERVEPRHAPLGRNP